MRRWTVAGGLLVVCLAATAVAGARISSGSSEDGAEITFWHAQSTPTRYGESVKGPIIRKHSVGIFIEGDYCSGGPIPIIDHVSLVELPVTKLRHYKAAVITAYKRWPAVVTEPAPSPNYAPKCGRVPRQIFTRVKTKRPAAKLRLFDGYYSPPIQVWPPLRQCQEPVPNPPPTCS
jgi:hypothetical protein